MRTGRFAAALVLGAMSLPVSAESAAPAERAAKAQVLIDMNPLLGGYRIEVQASDAGLRLEGAVANEIEATLATQLARLIAGEDTEVESALDLEAPMPEANSGLITEVQDRTTAARLQQRLRWQVRNIPLDVRAEVDREDDWIRGRLRALLQSDTTVNARSIEIKVREAVVTLSGSVTSSVERSVAETIAGNVPGVREIDLIKLA